ncbi:MAG: hypothetical protein HY730_04735 [Candidatus Tectomicrobia bacterium]|uniref:Rubrerythrin diiron-binding domain-containing protein n=1 Tax=Tectimicrobiota bacterium TaxID=2528274 RepID=A0A933GNA1_UNCTE|nr:hypothetical protein [Candidatus Tectomicrobia bacterium]
MQVDREEIRKAVAEDSGLLEIIRFAMDKERDAQELYEDGYRYANNKTAKELFRVLLEEEIMHEKRLEKVYKEIKDFLNRG